MVCVAAAAQQAAQPGMMKGFYNKNCDTQATSVHACKELLSQAASEVPLPLPADTYERAVQVAEWGCASGGNSSLPVLTICQALQQRVQQPGSQQKLQVHVSHVDVTSNSWTELFTCAKQYQQQVQASLSHIQVTFSGTGSSQYERNHPSNSQDLGYSFNALHWLSKWPCHLQHSMSPFTGKVLPEELAALTTQATEDLTTFLTLRADEFRPGGLLVLNYGTMDQAHSKWLGLFDGPQAVAEAMVAEGLLREEELGSLSPPIFFLDESSQRQVFDEVSDRWELLHYDVSVAVNPQVQQMLKEGGDAAACGQVVSNFMQAAIRCFMEAGLKKGGRDQAAVDALLDSFFERLAQHIAANPVPIGYPTTRVLLRRRE